MRCGLLGKTLCHSYSPIIHAMLGDYKYDLIEKDPFELEDFLRNGDWDGLNVTMPYKKSVLPLLDELTPVAKKLGAVNTIVRRDHRLIGHNTDYFGFHSMLRSSGLSIAGKKCLILGSGGASQVAQVLLQECGAQVVVISRTGKDNYANIHRHANAAILVNTTPVGMYPNTGISPVNLDLFPHLEGVLDVVYNPARTQLLMDAESRGLTAINGLRMLVAQAKESSEWFCRQNIPAEMIDTIFSAMKQKTENIILIGMPGCGKSTVGHLLALHSSRQFVDADAEIEKLAQKSIPRIFAEDGESVFRDWETKVLEIFGKQSSLVIATGGGCVTRPENHSLLHQNGQIFWLQRDIDQLPTLGRPLSSDLPAMYRIRAPLYAQFADHVIPNEGSPLDTAYAVLEVLT